MEVISEVMSFRVSDRFGRERFGRNWDTCEVWEIRVWRTFEPKGGGVWVSLLAPSSEITCVWRIGRSVYPF